MGSRSGQDFLRVTSAQEAAMRQRARKCPLCAIWMTGKPGLPNSKHLDHILPRNQGGTHTHGNVRIICFACNVRRPKDGRDYAGTFSLWAQGPVPAARQETCPAGQHPRNADSGGRRCAACREDIARKAAQLHGSGWVSPSWDLVLARFA